MCSRPLSSIKVSALTMNMKHGVAKKVWRCKGKFGTLLRSISRSRTSSVLQRGSGWFGVGTHCTICVQSTCGYSIGCYQCAITLESFRRGEQGSPSPIPREDTFLEPANGDPPSLYVFDHQWHFFQLRHTIKTCPICSKVSESALCRTCESSFDHRFDAARRSQSLVEWPQTYGSGRL